MKASASALSSVSYQHYLITVVVVADDAHVEVCVCV